MKRALVAVCITLSVLTLSAGIIMEERPIPFAPSDSFKTLTPLTIMQPLKTSFGDVLQPGSYTAKVEGSLKPGDIVITFFKGVTVAGKTIAHTAPKNIGGVSLLPSMNKQGSTNSAPTAVERPAASGFQPLGFTQLSNVKLTPDLGQIKLVIQSIDPNVKVQIETKLQPM